MSRRDSYQLRSSSAPSSGEKCLVPIIDSFTVTVYIGGMIPENQGMSMQELSDRSDTPVRTVRFYISQRLVPGPRGRGTSATYTEDHLQRLHLVRQLASRHLPLNEIRERLDRVSTEELAEVFEQERQLQARETEALESPPRVFLTTLLENARLQRSETVLGVRGTTPPTDRDTWRRVKVAAGIEIHISAEAEQRSAELVAELIDLSRQAAQKERRRKGT